MLSQSWIMVVSFAVRCRHRCKWHGDTVTRWRWRGGVEGEEVETHRCWGGWGSSSRWPLWRAAETNTGCSLTGWSGHTETKWCRPATQHPSHINPPPPYKSTHQRPLKRWCSSLIGCPSSDTRTRRVRAFTFCRLVGFSWVLSMILMATCSGKHKTHHTTASNQVSLFCCNSSGAGEIYRCSSNHYYYQTICNLLSLALAYFKRIQKGSVPYCGHVINCWSFTSFLLIHCGAYCDPWSIMSLFFFCNASFRRN